MSEQKLAPHRRDLLALGAVAGLAELPPAAAEPGKPVSEFGRWLDSIDGKQRQLFDVPEPNQGFGLIWSFVFLLTGPQAFGVAENELGVVVVMRHNGIPLALNDAMWSKYKLGAFFKLTDPATKAPATRNFFVSSGPGDLVVPDAALDRLLARGVRAGACNMAITVYSGIIAKQQGLPADQVRNEWIANLVSGVQLVPSGIVAINGAQSRGCGYCFAG
jgi:hypothetical protein